MIGEKTIREVAAALSANRDVVLTSPPGSGKTTRVPPALLCEPWLAGKKIVMLEPRRIAARACAEFIARSLGESVGGTVGYQVRLERRVSSRTRLEIVTEGLLAQRLLSDPELSDTGLVIFDEIHERSLQCDLAFAMALETRRALRPDLRLLAMSATIDAEEIARAMTDGDSPPPVRIEAEGRMFHVETRYLGAASMPAAVKVALAETDGDILCFLPGEGEIRRCETALGDIAGVDVLPLYGALPKEEQNRVFVRGGRRRVILSTSIAETSLTIEGVSCVVDSGLMRVPRFSPATGMTGLVTLPLSLDRAEQRRGRAGRLCPGVCYRLWTEAEELSRPKRAMPEILDADLCHLVLSSAAWGATRRCDLPWITPPPASSWNRAEALLEMLGAVDGQGALTEKGRAMSSLPMHPRLANMMIGARKAGKNCVERAALLAAVLEEGVRNSETDIRKVADDVEMAQNRQFSKRILQLAGRFAGSVPKFTGSVPIAQRGLSPNLRGLSPSDGMLLALAYPDRVAKNRGNGTFTMSCGRGAFLDRNDPLAKERYLVCCELDDRHGDAKIFQASPTSEEEIEELFAYSIKEEPICEWDRAGERVKCVIRRKFGAVTLSERMSPSAGGDSGETEAMLEGIRQKGVWNMPCWGKESWQLKSRINFLHRLSDSLPAKWPEISEDAILSVLGGFLSGMKKWRDLEGLDIAAVMDFILSEAGCNRQELDRLAPARLAVPSGSRMSVNYDGDEPTVCVRLQECFGMMESPKVAGGTVPVVMTLLSPAQRPIQVTKDLAGFWRGAYQLVRKDMRGRYPKHYWPEDPFSAEPTRRTVRATKGS